MDSKDDNRCNKSPNNARNGGEKLSADHKLGSTSTAKLNQNEGADSSSSNNLEDDGGVSGVRAKPAREIYRPPNLRPGRRSYHGKNQKYDGEQQFRSTNYNNSQSHAQSQFFVRHNRPRPFNIYAKEFHFNPGNSQYFMQQSHQPPPPTRPFYTALIQQQQQSGGQGHQNYYPIAHSKSSGTMMSQFQDYLQSQQKTFNSSPGPLKQGPGILSSSAIKPETMLQRNKSSGSIPTKPRVWFQEEPDDNKGFGSGNGQNYENIERPFSLLKIGAENKSSRQNTSNTVQLTKSRSMFYEGQQQQPQQTFTRQNQNSNPFYDNQTHFPRNFETNNNQVSGIQRSKSFGWNVQRSSSKDSTGATGPTFQNLAEFQLEKWPINVQEAITATITGADRVPARSRIEMVTLIFSVLFGQQNVPKPSNLEQNNAITFVTDYKSLTIPAARILIFFIQKEKDSTIQESLLNTSYATFKDLFCGKALSGGVSPTNWSFDQCTLYPPKWVAFLNFISSIYSMLKNIRVPAAKSLEDLSLALLSLLCDCCLAIIRTSPDFYTNELLETMFTVLTSLGRDIEAKLPLKMKQILAAIRDLLLGISPYFNQTSSLQPAAQKTFMQLIELHAANWNLPASAVRYYYAHPSNGNEPQLGLISGTGNV